LAGELKPSAGIQENIMAGKATLGFIGLGTMGGVMASRLLEAGHGLTVFDANPAAVEALTTKGAVAAAGASAVASAAEIIFASLPTPDVVRAVALGDDGVAKGKKVRIFVDLSTTGPRVSGEVAAGLAARNIVLVDAPVSGGRGGAIKGTLAVMAAAPRAAFDEVESFLGVFGKVFYVGEKAGLAQTMKLVNNMLSVAALAITSEGMVMGVKAGLDPQTMLDVINVSTGRNSATVDKFPRAVLPRTFDFGFATGLSMKDIRLCLQEADAMGVPMPVGSAVQQVLSITNAMFGPQSDFTSICKLIEQWGGAEVKSAKPAR
jgi:3-hydroxyisobutyrate dehydrogenase-like beta-hydroxyacid dehydrogenase